jgi:hypothetical protein
MRGISDECREWRPAVYYPRSDILDRPPSGLTVVHRNFGLGEVCSKPPGIFLLGYPIAGRPGTGAALAARLQKGLGIDDALRRCAMSVEVETPVPLNYMPGRDRSDESTTTSAFPARVSVP